LVEDLRPRQHWLPAVHLAKFSADVDPRKPRDRRLYVRKRNVSALQFSAARTLAYSRGLYDMKHELEQAFPNGSFEDDFLDHTFNAYERRLSVAYEEVSQSEGHISFEVWMKVLVPFIAGITVRHPNFLGNPPNSVLIQMSRLFEMTRLLAPLMVAGWHFVTPPTGRAFIVSDSGFITTLDTGTNRPGLFVPLGCGAGLEFTLIRPLQITLDDDEINLGKHAMFFVGKYVEISDAEVVVEPLSEYVAGRYSGELEPGRVLVRPAPAIAQAVGTTPEDPRH
jgi:hypothetical protein